jgi:hypothetical protein
VALTDERRLSAREVIFFFQSSYADVVGRVTGCYLSWGDGATGALKHKAAGF